jgi:hypothetical protein
MMTLDELKSKLKPIHINNDRYWFANSACRTLKLYYPRHIRKIPQSDIFYSPTRDYSLKPKHRVLINENGLRILVEASQKRPPRLNSGFVQRGRVSAHVQVFLDTNRDLPRAEAIKALVERGLAESSARTQYSRYALNNANNQNTINALE